MQFLLYCAIDTPTNAPTQQTCTKMPRFVLLLRGVNVSGANIVKMADFRGFLAGLGFENAGTYIQSGNAVFSSPKSIDEARRLVQDSFPASFGFLPKMMLLPADELAAAIAGNPFSAPDIDPARLHAGFMEGQPDAEALTRIAAKARVSEEYEIRGRVFYLFTPDGFGKSKFAEGLERALKVAVTFRNWRTVLALNGMANPWSKGF
jgi:uncharacterized protein (DUF1697 family)